MVVPMVGRSRDPRGADLRLQRARTASTPRTSSSPRSSGGARASRSRTRGCTPSAPTSRTRCRSRSCPTRCRSPPAGTSRRCTGRRARRPRRAATSTTWSAPTTAGCVVMGDVTGKGARAASVTALARYTLRTAAMLTGDPAVALSALNLGLMRHERASACAQRRSWRSSENERRARPRARAERRPSAAGARPRRAGHARSGGPGPLLGALEAADVAGGRARARGRATGSSSTPTG